MQGPVSLQVMCGNCVLKVSQSVFAVVYLVQIFPYVISFPTFCYRLNYVNVSFNLVSPYPLHKAVEFPFCWLSLYCCYMKQYHFPHPTYVDIISDVGGVNSL